MENITSINLRTRISEHQHTTIDKNNKKNNRLVKRSVESISADQYLSEIAYYDPTHKIRYNDPIYKNFTNGDSIKKESYDILDYVSQGVVVTLVRISQLKKYNKDKVLYCALWVTVTPAKLLKTNDIEHWKKHLKKELNLIMEDLSPYIKSISQFNVKYMSSEFPITFEKSQESSEYYNLLHNSAFHNQYSFEDTSCNDDNGDIFISNDTESFELFNGTHSLYVKRVGSQINLGILLKYDKLYDTAPRGVKTLGYILESLEQYTIDSIVTCYGNVYGNSSYVKLSNICITIDKCQHSEKKKNRMLALVEETNTLGNLNKVLEKITDRKERNKTKSDLILIKDLGVSPLALSEDSTLTSLPGPLIKMFDARQNIIPTDNVPMMEVNDND